MKRSLIVLAALVAVSCGAGRPIEIVVPDGFVGEARLVYDPQNGKDLEPAGFSYIFRIPASGELRIKDQAPFFRWHAESVRHEGGKRAKISQVYLNNGGFERPDGSSYSSTTLPGTTHVWVVASQ